MGELQLKAKETGRKVTQLHTKEGGFEMGHHGVRTVLPGPIAGIEMEESSRGVLVTYAGRNAAGKVTQEKWTIPYSNVRQYRVEE